MSKKFIVLVGNIGTGKSTIVKQIVKHNYCCISRDSLRYMIGAGKYIFDPFLEPCIWRSERSIIQIMMNYDENIVVDEVGVSKSLRAPYLKLAIINGYEIIAYVMPKLSKKICVDRRVANSHGNNSRKVWERVWDQFNLVYSKPTLKEGFDKVIDHNKSGKKFISQL